MRRFAYLALRPPLEVLSILLLVSCTSGARGRAAQTSQTSAGSAAGSGGAPARAPASHGGFVLVHDKDAMTDQDRSFVTESDADSSAILAWRCRGPETQLYVKTLDFLDSDPVSVEWRLDSARAQGPNRWTPSTTGTGLFAPDAVMVRLTDGALRAHMLRVRAVDFQGTPHDYEFSLTGLGTALKGLRCSLAAARKRLADARAVMESELRREREARRRDDSIQAVKDRIRAAREAFAREWPVVGDPVHKTYMPTAADCWRIWVDSAKAAFFKSVRDAEKAGYRKSPICPP